jgi:NhaP-type Na+/H+ or K+/H+ antiporter
VRGLPKLGCVETERFTGYIFSRLLRFAHSKGFLERESYIAQYIGLALFTTGATNSLGNDDLLAAFAAGVFVPHQKQKYAHSCV